MSIIVYDYKTAPETKENRLRLEMRNRNKGEGSILILTIIV